jgi:hypothetical protein
MDNLTPDNQGGIYYRLAALEAQLDDLERRIARLERRLACFGITVGEHRRPRLWDRLGRLEGR